MTNTTKPAAQEIDPATLDQIAGAGAAVPEADLRKQAQGDKLSAEETNFANRPGGFSGGTP